MNILGEAKTKYNKLYYIIFLLSFTIFIVILNFRLSNGLNIILFWISISGMIFTVVYQIFKIPETNKLVILSEILIINVCLHLLFQIGFLGLSNRDAYDDVKLLQFIINDGSFNLSQQPGVSSWPAIHLFASSFALITGMDYFNIAKYLPSFFTSLIILGIFLLSTAIYKSYKVALLACLVFATIPKYMIFGSAFVREIFGLFCIITAFYLIYVSKIRDNRFVVLVLIFSFLILISHHFSSFMFLVLLLIFLIMAKFVPIFFNKIPFRKIKKQEMFHKININTIFLIIVVLLFAYWLYSAVEIWDNIGKFASNLVTLGQIPDYSVTSGLTSAVVTFKGQIIFYGFYIFFAIFGLLLTIKLLIDTNKTKVEDFTLIFFLFFAGIYGFLSLYFIESLISPDRLLTYGWLLGVIPLAGFLLTLKNSFYFKKVFILLLVIFMLFNIYSIPTEYIDKNFNVLGVSNDKEYAMAETMILPLSYSTLNNPNVYYGYVDIFYGYEGARNAFYDKQNTLGENLFNIKSFNNSTSIAIINEDNLLKDINIVKIKSPIQYEQIINITNFKNGYSNEICDVGYNTYILKPV